MPQDAHQLDRQVVAVIENGGDHAIDDLRAAGYDVEVLEGEEGRRHLDADGSEHGGGVRVQRIISMFGEERRILERLDEALESGLKVVAVHTPDDPAEVTSMLQDAGSEWIWRFDGWTHERAGD